MGTEKKFITKEELGEHNKPGDLWISIQGKIYDVSQWAKEHPGGDIPLLNLSGQDATDAFIAFHPGTAWAHLDRLFTGSCDYSFHIPLCTCYYDCSPPSPPEPKKCNVGLGMCTTSCQTDCCNAKCASQYNQGVGFCQNIAGFDLCQCTYSCG